MYNRYIPQPDGTYRKNRMQEPPRQEQPCRHTPPPKQKKEPPKQECHDEKPVVCEPAQHPRRKEQPKTNDNITGFFKQLLPKDLETADLLIIILLLLMAGDCEEDRNNALLTLALYFFM